MSVSRSVLMNRAKAKRIYRLREEGISCKEVAEIVGVPKDQIRKLQLLGERLINNENQ